MAVNCWVVPVGNVGAAGEMAIETRAAAVTARVAPLLVTPLDVALIVVEPMARELADPDALIDAMAGIAELHVADKDKSWVEPSV
jgi:hypothetical protein